MVWPLVALVAAGGAIGAGSAILAGMTKKEASISTTTSQQNVYHAAMENYQPSIQFSPVSSNAYQGATTIINSPNTVGSKQATAQTSNPVYDASWSTPQTASPSVATGTSATTGIDWTMIAIIGAVAVVGYALFKK